MRDDVMSSWFKYGAMFDEGDIVEIEMDLQKAEIKLEINGIDQGVAFKNVVKTNDMDYILIRSLSCIADSVEILDFKKI